MCTKENSIPTCRLTHLCMFRRKMFISPRWGPDKIKSDPICVGWHTSHMNTLCFYRSFLRKVKSHLGEPAHQTGLADFHMNSSLNCPNKTSNLWHIKKEIDYLYLQFDLPFIYQEHLILI